jgi:hypothetical protein
MDTDELVIIDAGLSMSFESLPTERSEASLPTQAQDIVGTVSRHPSPSASDAVFQEEPISLSHGFHKTGPMPHQRLIRTPLSKENVSNHEYDRGLDIFLSKPTQDGPVRHHSGPIRVQSVSEIPIRQKDLVINSARCYPHSAHPVSR